MKSATAMAIREGRKVLEDSIPSELFQRALLAPGLDRKALEEQLTRLLEALQSAYGRSRP